MRLAFWRKEKQRECCADSRDSRLRDWLRTVGGKNPFIYQTSNHILSPDRARSPDSYFIERYQVDSPLEDADSVIERMCICGRWYQISPTLAKGRTYTFKSSRVADEHVRRLNYGVPKAPELAAGALGVGLILVEILNAIATWQSRPLI